MMFCDNQQLPSKINKRIVADTAIWQRNRQERKQFVSTMSTTTTTTKASFLLVFALVFLITVMTTTTSSFVIRSTTTTTTTAPSSLSTRDLLASTPSWLLHPLSFPIITSTSSTTTITTLFAKSPKKRIPHKIQINCSSSSSSNDYTASNTLDPSLVPISSNTIASDIDMIKDNYKDDDDNDTAVTAMTIPANLKRNIQAKRPPLGHVVPAFTKTKGAGGKSNPKLRLQGKAREAGMNNPSMLKILGGTAKGRRLDSPTVYLRPMMGKVKEAVYSTLQSFGVYSEGGGGGTITTAANYHNKKGKKIRHLDLFAGSGSVGLESLSRGAYHCTFCDLSQDCCDCIQRNIEWCQFTPHNKREDDLQQQQQYSTHVLCADVMQLLRDPGSVGLPVHKMSRPGEMDATNNNNNVKENIYDTSGIDNWNAYDVITICPPYEEVVYADLLDAVANSKLVKDDTIILLEYPVELWGDIPHVYQGTNNHNKNNILVGIRNRKYGRTVIAMYICNPTGERWENVESRPEEFL